MNYPVSIRKAENVFSAVSQAVEDLGGIDKFISPGDKVLLKPNINGTECVTNISVVEALIKLLKEIDVKEITIAEASFGTAGMTDQFMKKNGYYQLAEKTGVKLVNINADNISLQSVKDPLNKNSLKISETVIKADKIINLPVMKVHYGTGITLCLKNMKGILVGDEKRSFHEQGLDECIVDLNRTVRPDLNIVDATFCMEGMGPRGGNIFPLGLILAGTDAACTDYVGMKIMDYSLDEVKHLALYLEKEEIDTGNIRIFGKDIESVKRPFKKVRLENIIGPETVINTSDECSSCCNALYLSLSFAKDKIKGRQTFHLGSKPNNDAIKPEDFVFGNCAVKASAGKGIPVKGCPPYPFELGRLLE